ncbi:TolC family outer membrane protein [Limnohabitans sp. 2KL-27]|uniref:TolC family outer membrane protein n=1 Tax=Limnohabitans sp. 2KL-27 TaxID=1100705 RepID=UPI000AD2D566|nr:TolC family outer membrane protein [Limnohabitans sp. 2KL-27]
MTLRLLPLTLSLAAALAGTAQAQSLAQLYEAAKGYDAAYKAAQSQYQANLAKAEQAKALLRPTAGLGATLSESDFNNLTSTNADARYGTRTATLSASQPLFRPANMAGYQQGAKQVGLAQAQLKAAAQELIVRVSQAYFDVLIAQDSLAFVKAQKTAVSEQLAAAKRNFEVGTSTITDTREAQARFDLVTAQEIAAENDLRVKKLALDQSVGTPNTQPVPLKSGANLNAALTGNADTWAQQAAEQSPNVEQARIGLEVAQLETEKAKAGHMPTLDLTASYGATRFRNGNPSSRIDNNTGTIGLSFNLPLYAGHATQNRIQETVALKEKARNDLEGAQRSVAQATRTAYFGVQSGLGQVKALEAAEASSQSALDANKLGYQVGVRINIDVLNSQSQLFQTKRDLAKARYDVLLGQLKLRLAAGVLKAEDVQTLNSLFGQ